MQEEHNCLILASIQEWMETVQLSLPKYNMPDILYGILPANAKNS